MSKAINEGNDSGGDGGGATGGERGGGEEGGSRYRLMSSTVRSSRRFVGRARGFFRPRKSNDR